MHAGGVRVVGVGVGGREWAESSSSQVPFVHPSAPLGGGFGSGDGVRPTGQLKKAAVTNATKEAAQKLALIRFPSGKVVVRAIDPTTEEESGGDVDITRPPLQKRPRAALDDPLSRARTFDPPDPPASWAQGAALMPPPPPRLPMALPVGAPPARDAPGVGGLVHRQAHSQAQGRPAALTVD